MAQPTSEFVVVGRKKGRRAKAAATRVIAHGKF
jgi:hypothetical protein